MAQGSIRIRCAMCRQLKLSEKICPKHIERTFQARYPKGDGADCVKTFRLKGDAEKWLKSVGSEVDSGTFQEIRPQKLKDVADNYLLSHRGNIRPATYSIYTYHVNWIKAALGEYEISKITNKMLSDFMARYLHDSGSQRQKIQCRLKGIFKLAELEGAIKKNPANYLKSIKDLKIKKDASVLPPARIKELLDAVDDPMKRLYYQLALYTGMRPNELCGLRKDFVDLDKFHLRVNQTLYYFKTKEERGNCPQTYAVLPCKSPAAYRILPLGKELIAPLQIRLIEAPENPLNLLFTKKDGSPLDHNSDIVDDHYNPLIKILNRRTEFPIMEFYDCTRHTYASMLFEMGINLKKVQYLMGHEKFETTANLYARIFGKNISEDNEFRGVANKMEAFVNSSVSMPCP